MGIRVQEECAPIGTKTLDSPLRDGLSSDCPMKRVFVQEIMHFKKN